MVYLYLLAEEKGRCISHLYGQSCLSMVTVPHKTKSLITLDANFLNHSSPKSMEVAMQIKLTDLQNTQSKT